ncbi:unnamed protein product, partial [marine sediment metagenome]
VVKTSPKKVFILPATHSGLVSIIIRYSLASFQSDAWVEA